MSDLIERLESVLQVLTHPQHDKAVMDALIHIKALEKERQRMASTMLDIAYGRYEVIGDTPEYMCWHNLPDKYTKNNKWPDEVEGRPNNWPNK